MGRRQTSPRWFVLGAVLSLTLALMLYLQIHFLWFGPRSPGQLLGSVFASFCAFAMSVAALVTSVRGAHLRRWRVSSVLLLIGSGAMCCVGCMQSVFIT